MGDSLDTVPFNHSWYETLNGGAGLFALAVAIIFVFIIIIVFIIRIIQLPRLRQQVIDDFSVVDNTRSVPTRILKVIIFLLLTAGLVGVIYFNISKMIYDSPKISVALIKNNMMAPFMLFCNGEKRSLKYTSAEYYPAINGISESAPIDLVQQFSIISGKNGECQFFNGTMFLKPISDSSEGTYSLSFIGDASGIIVFIGDNNTNMDWTLTIPQGNLLSNVGVQVLEGNGGTIQYTETRHTDLNENVDRSFQISVIETVIIEPALNGTRINVTIFEPRIVTNQVENPSITLADLFSDGNVELGTWEKEEKEVDIDTKTSILSNQAEFKNLLSKYYVETDYYEHAVENIILCEILKMIIKDDNANMQHIKDQI
uniref:Uncharacterized protein n=1 Tax=Rhizophagus irregularis (strain DAOM 181602 / DAOM 197198 / MUCL 43194) TaxID=747089 RepID=U9UUI5_RHIID